MNQNWVGKSFGVFLVVFEFCVTLHPPLVFLLICNNPDDETVRILTLLSFGHPAVFPRMMAKILSF